MKRESTRVHVNLQIAASPAKEMVRELLTPFAADIARTKTPATDEAPHPTVIKVFTIAHIEHRPVGRLNIELHMPGLLLAHIEHQVNPIMPAEVIHRHQPPHIRHLTLRKNIPLHEPPRTRSHLLFSHHRACPGGTLTPCCGAPLIQNQPRRCITNSLAFKLRLSERHIPPKYPTRDQPRSRMPATDQPRNGTRQKLLAPGGGPGLVLSNCPPRISRSLRRQTVDLPRRITILFKPIRSPGIVAEGIGKLPRDDRDGPGMVTGVRTTKRVRATGGEHALPSHFIEQSRFAAFVNTAGPTIVENGYRQRVATLTKRVANVKALVGLAIGMVGVLTMANELTVQPHGEIGVGADQQLGFTARRITLEPMQKIYVLVNRTIGLRRKDPPRITITDPPSLSGLAE